MVAGNVGDDGVDGRRWIGENSAGSQGLWRSVGGYSSGEEVWEEGSPWGGYMGVATGAADGGSGERAEGLCCRHCERRMDNGKDQVSPCHLNTMLDMRVKKPDEGIDRPTAWRPALSLARAKLCGSSDIVP